LTNIAKLALHQKNIFLAAIMLLIAAKNDIPLCYTVKPLFYGLSVSINK